MRQAKATVLIFMAVMAAALMASAASLDRFMVRGYIYDEEYNPLDSVEVDLRLNDTIPVEFKLLRGDNATRLTSGKELRLMVESGMGNYCLTLYKEGYDLLVKRFSISSASENVKYISSLVLEKERHVDLGEVTVQATRVKMVMKGDTLVFDAAAFQLAEGSMLDALVRQLPGATLSPDGVIEVNGRKINELLVNGKDFFQGDPKVALQNLPAYTVKNLKVYDKADKDAYLTHSDARLDKREEDENLVMDVVLKKEFDNGWLANAEAGYGTKHRYMGRAFGLGYTDKFRLAAFVNANNTGDHTQGGTSGQWRGASSTENGMLDIFTTGLDYNYTLPDKVEASGNLTYKGVTERNHDITASTRFFSAGDIFSRSRSDRRNRTRSLSTQHYFNYRMPNAYFYITPNFSWRRTDNDRDNRSATFSRAPEESFRGEAVDSLFSARSSGRFSQYMLTRLREMAAAQGDAMSGNLSARMTLRPKTWKGMMNFSANGGLNRNSSDTHTYYDQAYGPASQSQGVPVRNNRFSGAEKSGRSASASASYSQDMRSFGDSRTVMKRFQGTVSFSHQHDKNDNRLYLSDSLPDPLTPPSAVMPAGLLLDPANSPLTISNSNALASTVSFSYSTEPTTPGDSTFNATLGVNVLLAYTHLHQSLHYIKTDITDQHVSRNTELLTPQLSIYLNSSNKVRNISASLYYSCRKMAPSITYLIDTYDSSNPLNISVGNPDGLADAMIHSLNFSWRRFARSASNARVSVYGDWSVTTNQTAMARRYDPQTGVTINRPENISGNWDGSLGVSGAVSFGRRRNLTVNGSFNATVRNSADYAAINAQPVRSSVMTQEYRPSVSLDYTASNGSTISVGMSATIESQHSAREDFNDMTWYAYWPYVRAFLKLPAGFELNTQFNPYFRRGFSDPQMNTTEYVWNATLSKSFPRPAITLRLTANDILGSAKHVYTTVNAQGRSENWRYTMPRYVMLTVGYRLDMKPRSGKAARPSRY